MFLRTIDQTIDQNKKMTIAASTGSAPGLIPDSDTVATIRNFLSNEAKPRDLQPVDILHIVYLMVRKAEDHGINDSKLTLSQRFNCSQSTVVRSRDRLKQAHYIEVERRKGRTSSTSISIDNVPAESTLRAKLSPEARRLAERYSAGLVKIGKKRFSKHWLSNQTPTAQRILESCGGDMELAAKIIGRALGHPIYKKKAKKSLYELYGQWGKLVTLYEAENLPANQQSMPIHRNDCNTTEGTPSHDS